MGFEKMIGGFFKKKPEAQGGNMKIILSEKKLMQDLDNVNKISLTNLASEGMGGGGKGSLSAFDKYVQEYDLGEEGATLVNEIKELAAKMSEVKKRQPKPSDPREMIQAWNTDSVGLQDEFIQKRNKVFQKMRAKVESQNKPELAEAA